MIVEFTGIPGTGKSTLLPFVKHLLHQHGLKAMSCEEAERWCLGRTFLGRMISTVPSAVGRELATSTASCLVIVFSVLKFSLENSRLVRDVLVFQMNRRMPCLHFAIVLRNFVLTAGYYHFFREHLEAGEAVLVDEGFVHRVVSLYVSESENADPEVVENYLKLLPHVDLVIFVKAPLGVCLERIVRRRVPRRLRGLALPKIAQALANMERAIEIASRHLGGRGWLTLEADNTRALRACVGALNDGLKTAVSSNWRFSCPTRPRLEIGYAGYAN